MDKLWITFGVAFVQLKTVRAPSTSIPDKFHRRLSVDLIVLVTLYSYSIASRAGEVNLFFTKSGRNINLFFGEISVDTARV